MKSFGIYYKNLTGLTGNIGQSEIQMNVWKLSKNKKNLYYVDFGLQFDSQIEEIFVFVPFKIDKDNIKDLGSIISKNADLVSRIFNSETTSNQSTQSSFTPITKEGGKTFEICNLDIENKAEIEYKTSDNRDFSILKIELPKKIGQTKTKEGVQSSTTTAAEQLRNNYYIRFRLIVDKENLLSKTENVANDVVQSAFSKLELFDIRLNDTRHIPSNITQIIQNDKHGVPFYFQKVHYFYMVDVRESIQTTSPSCHDSRFLELNDWKEYLIDDQISEKNFISYHWKKVKLSEKDENIKSYQLCYSCLFPDRNFLQLLSYAGLAIILGFIGSMLCFEISDFVQDFPFQKLIKPGIVIIILGLEIFYFWKYNNKS